MYDELVKNLRKMESGEYCAVASTEDFPVMQFVKDAADAIEELVEDRDMYIKAMADEHNRAARLAWEHRWIPVTEQLPLLNTPVLVTDGIEVDISWMYGVPPRWITSYTAINEDKLTHWMPLPKTPKEG